MTALEREHNGLLCLSADTVSVVLCVWVLGDRG